MGGMADNLTSFWVGVIHPIANLFVARKCHTWIRAAFYVGIRTGKGPERVVRRAQEFREPG